MFTKSSTPGEKLDALTAETAISIVSYNTWNTYADQLLSPLWQSYTFDEFHRLRKAKGATWSQIYRLRTKTRSRHQHTPIRVLTGTPLVRDAGDIYPFLSLCNQSRWRYNGRRKFVEATCHTFAGEYKLHVGAVRDPQAFRRLLGQYSIRRRWQDIPSLASLQRRDIQLPIALDRTTINRHRGIVKDWRDPLTGEPMTSSGQRVHALRRLSVPAKVAATTEFVQDHPGRLLLLAWYRDTARECLQAVQRMKLPCAYVDGSTNLREREAAYRLYRRDPRAIIVGTIGSLKEGLNLQAGSQILFVEQHFLPSDNEQSVSRLLRQGQTQPVLVHWLYAKNSFDVRIRRIARSRKANIDQALEEFVQNEEWNAYE